MKKQAIMWLSAVLLAALVVGCGQKKGWQEKQIEGDVVYLLESDEIIQNDTLDGRALLGMGISPKNDTIYSIYIPSKRKKFSEREEYMEMDDYIVVNNQKYRLPFMATAWTVNAVPEQGIPSGYEINLNLTFDEQTTPNFFSMPKIEVSYHHHNETPINMTFVAE